MFYVLIGIVVTTVALLVFNHDAGEVFGYPIETVGSVALLSTLLLFLLSGRNQRKGTILKSVKYLFMWLLVGLALMLGYSFKDEAKILVNRVASELLPGSGVVANNGEVSFRRTLDGHFQVQADINGSTIPMMVDSGASSVVLTHEDALTIGIDTANLNYASPVNTANGKAYTARIWLNKISVGGIEAKHVPAMVAQEQALSESLLGMSYLDRLQSWTVSGNKLTMKP